MNVEQIKHYENRIDQLKQERDELQSWKDSQLKVESEWSPQEIGRVLGLPIGVSIRAELMPAIQRLIAERDGALRNLQMSDNRREELRAKLRDAEDKCKQLDQQVYQCGMANIELREHITTLKESRAVAVEQEQVSRNECNQLRAKCAEMREAQIKFPDNLSALTVGLVLRFAQAMAEKLSAAQIKHGYGDGWAETTHEWPVPECREALMAHLKKGDPVDVANFCAFLWYHQIGTAECGKSEK